MYFRFITKFIFIYYWQLLNFVLPQTLSHFEEAWFFNQLNTVGKENVVPLQTLSHFGWLSKEPWFYSQLHTVWNSQKTDCPLTFFLNVICFLFDIHSPNLGYSHIFFVKFAQSLNKCVETNQAVSRAVQFSHQVPWQITKWTGTIVSPRVLYKES